MKYLSNDTNNLSNKILDEALIAAEQLLQDDATRFEAGICNTTKFGRVSGLSDIFRNSVVAACASKNITLDVAALRSKITVTPNGVAFGGIETGAYKQANYKPSLYSREFAQTFKTAMGPDIRAQMLEPLRAVIAQQTTQAQAKREPALIVS